VPREVACHGNGLSAEEFALIPGEESADGRGGTRNVPKAGTGGRRGTGWWTEAWPLTSSSYCPVPNKGVQHRLEHREEALQLATRDGWNAWSRGLTS
jgi:hypothetical protein